MTPVDELQQTMADLVQPGKGILAADESTPTITKRFKAAGIESNEETRRAYRALLLGTAGIGDYLSGVILYEETLDQTDGTGRPLTEVAAGQGIVPGIKVDKGTTELPNTEGDKITEGLDGLRSRLADYKRKGARFAKWRDVYRIGDGHHPTRLAIKANAEVLARYAAACQTEGIVPIVEPEVLMDGDHGIDRTAEVTGAVLHAVFHALHRHRVALELMLLKPNMVVPGKASGKASPDQVAERTITVLRRTVPAAVQSIHFLSGGQTPEEATANLHAINARYTRQPWRLSFSFARALQEPAMAAWAGRPEGIEEAQKALYHRARMAALAVRGEYDPALESEGVTR